MGGGRRLGPACTAFHLASSCLALLALLIALPGLSLRLSAWSSAGRLLACSHAGCSALVSSPLLSPLPCFRPTYLPNLGT